MLRFGIQIPDHSELTYLSDEEIPNDTVCYICFEGITNSIEDNRVVRLECNHIFHENCIRRWFQRSNTCPTCRTSVGTTSDIQGIMIDFISYLQMDIYISHIDQLILTKWLFGDKLLNLFEFIMNFPDVEKNRRTLYIKMNEAVYTMNESMSSMSISLYTLIRRNGTNRVEVIIP